MIKLRNIAVAIFAAIALCTTAQGRLVTEVNNMSPDRKVAYAARLIEQFYLDDVDGEKMAEEAIKAMLLMLDPHSTYSDPDETKELTTPLDGNFSGIGIQFNMLSDTLTIIQPTSGGPSEKVGILPGDRIISADGKAISGAGLSNSDVIKILRGPKGTAVNLKILRKGVDKLLDFTVIRNDIPVNSVEAAYMADPTTGYISITRFAENTDKEFVEAMKTLRKQGMKNLIVDLEDNGGGYLGTATALASHFLRKGDLVTYTESPKMGETRYDVQTDGDFLDGRIVVMVNQYSASASEILSGALQDNDRALIVGRRTFGKGLVQRPFPFPDGSMVKLTVSRYHTPSGRSIQKPYIKGHAEDYRMDMVNRYENGEFLNGSKTQFPDSLKYTTIRNRRTVYGGGGIMPDLFVPVDTTAYSDYYRDLVAKGVLNKVALNYVEDNREAIKSRYPDSGEFIASFKVPENVMRAIVTTGTKDGVEFRQGDYTRSKKMMETVMKGLIGRSIYEASIYRRIVNDALNPTFKAALDLINDTEQYLRLLSGE